MSETLNSIQELGRLGQSVWYDNMYRSLITSGELERLVETGVTGLTSNPTIFQKAISSGSEYDDSLVKHASRGLNPEQSVRGAGNGGYTRGGRHTAASV